MYSDITIVFKRFRYIVESSNTYSVIILLVRSVIGKFVEGTQFLTKIAVPPW